MQVHKQLPQSILAALVAVAVAAPAAGAAPMYDGHPPTHATGTGYDVDRVTGAYTPAGASADMHASTVGTTFEKSVTGGDLRTEAAKSPIVSRVDTVDGTAPDLRTEAAKDPVGPTPPVGMPTWPVDPKPIVPAAPQPVQATDTDGGSIDWPLVGILAASTLAMAGAAFVVTRRTAGHAH
jgi:hypothetical protein